MKPQSKNYNRLTGDERFRLSLAAMARNDRAEAAALGDTCPRNHYTMRDYSFHRRMDASLHMMTALALELAPYLTVIRELDWQVEHLGELMDTLALSGVDAAVEAHWQALDPDGSAETRMERRLKMPEIEEIVRGPAGDGVLAVDRLKAAQKERSDRASRAVSVILAGFDAFARKHWGVSGDDALAAHAELFPELQTANSTASDESPDDKAAEHAAARLACFWRSLVKV